jgi:hypothetical protein
MSLSVSSDRDAIDPQGSRTVYRAPFGSRKARAMKYF